ncbi:hypothetical protein HY493_02440 [Candidatus Woesearchaeota archaeon]|nr:hypothetical protein [Candidatus Woesearchaeota archaeon]
MTTLDTTPTFICDWDGHKEGGEPVRAYEKDTGLLFCGPHFATHRADIDGVVFRANLRQMLPVLWYLSQ